MTVQSTVNKITHLVSDIGQTEYIYDFRVDESDHMIVYLNDIEQSQGDYTVNDLGSLTGGTITISFTTALDDQLLILREMPLTQLLDYITYGKFPSATHEKGLDYGVMIDQQLQEAYSRAMRFPVYDDVDPILPSPQDQYALVWEDNALVNKFFADASSEILIYNDHDLSGRHLVYESIADLRASTLTPFDGQVIKNTGYYAGTENRDWFFKWNPSDLSTEVATDTQGGFYVALDSDLTGASGAWERLYEGTIHAIWFGILKGSTDNTDIYTAMVNAVIEGSTIKFEFGTYVGNLLSSKSLNIDYQGSTVKPGPVSDTDSPIHFIGSAALETSVIGTLAYGDREITVADIGDITENSLIYLVDEKVKPSTAILVNYELVKVASVLGNVITVNDMVRSDQDDGVISVYLIDPIDNPSVKNVTLDMSGTSTAPGLYFQYCRNPISKNAEVNNFVGNAIRFEFCYNLLALNSRPVDPTSVTSGNGYGVVALQSRLGTIRDIFANGNRHPFDVNGSYDIHGYNIHDPNGQSGGLITLAHNTFGGNNSVQDVFVTNDGFAVDVSSQGVSIPSDFISRDMSVKTVRHIVPTTSVDAFNVSVYVQTSYANLIIDDISITYLNSAAVPNTNASGVRLNGTANGPGRVTNITAPKIGILVAVSVGASSAPITKDILEVCGLRATEAYELIRFGGDRQICVDDISCPTIISDQAIALQKSSTWYPVVTFIGNAIFTDETKLVVGFLSFSSQEIVFGSFPALGFTGGVVVKANGDVISNLEVQQRSASLFLEPPTAADITLNAVATIAPASVQGQVLKISLSPNRGGVIIPAVNDSVYTDGVTPILLTKGRVWTLIGAGDSSGKWFVQGV